MGKVYEKIDSKMRDWVAQQRLFFVATAPLAGDGLLNCSPKGMDTFRILDDHTVAYLDLTGSGVETIAHLKENGRIVIMFCAFEGPPNIIRFYGQGEAIEPNHPEFAALQSEFPTYPGIRSVIRVHVTRIADSCGFAIPLYDYQGERDTLIRYAERKGPEGMADYRAENNVQSLDGLPGLEIETVP